MTFCRVCGYLMHACACSAEKHFKIFLEIPKHLLLSFQINLDYKQRTAGHKSRLQRVNSTTIYWSDNAAERYQYRYYNSAHVEEGRRIRVSEQFIYDKCLLMENVLYCDYTVTFARVPEM